jgi:hypothetical protein
MISDTSSLLSVALTPCPLSLRERGNKFYEEGLTPLLDTPL